jgi:hypothetical protein
MNPVTLTLTLDETNMVLAALDKNTLGVSVMQVAVLIQKIQEQTKEALNPQVPAKEVEK